MKKLLLNILLILILCLIPIKSQASFVSIASKWHKKLSSAGYTYDSGPLKYLTSNYSLPKYDGKKITDCSHFVSLALYEYGYTDLFSSKKQLNSSGFKKIGASLKNSESKYAQKFQLIKSTSNLKKGDILSYNGHVEIFYKKNGTKPYVLNCGSNDSIKVTGYSKSSHKLSQIKYILRVRPYHVSINKTSISLEKNDKNTLKVASNVVATRNWSSNNTKVATVSKAGVVTAKNPGVATITVTSSFKNNHLSDTCKVYVHGIILNKSDEKLEVGKTLTLKATSSSSKITWTSSDTSVATVSSKGVVKTKKSGVAYITAKITSGGKTYTAKCKIIGTYASKNY